VELSEVTTLLLASSTAAVSVLVDPEATLDVPEVKASFVAVPGVTVNVDVSVVRPPPCFAACTVTEPAVCPVTVSEATPAEAVASAGPLAEPAPAACEKTTTVELSQVTTLLLASSTAAVSVLVDPEATLAVPEVKASFVAVPGVTVNVELSVVRPPPCFAACTVTEPAVCPVTVSDATPAEAV